MLRTFNMGIGLILVCTPALVDAVLDDLRSRTESPILLGESSPAIDACCAEKGPGLFNKTAIGDHHPRRNCDLSTHVTLRATS